MATTLIPQPQANRLIRWYLQWSGARRLRVARDMFRAELYWLRSQLVVAVATNKRISEANDSLTKERDQLKQEVQRFTIVDPNAQCPSCGHCGGKIKSIPDPAQRKVAVQHTCDACSFQFFEDSIAPDAFKVWLPTPDPTGNGVLGI
jgi:hypothetical protein